MYLRGGDSSKGCGGVRPGVSCSSVKGVAQLIRVNCGADQLVCGVAQQGCDVT